MNKNINNKEHKLLFAILVSVFSFLIFGCPDPMTVDNSQLLINDSQPTFMQGKGSITLTLSGTTRTIMPSAPALDDFALYSLSFTPYNGGETVNIDRTKAALAEAILLEHGMYSLTVNAYKDSGKTQLLARGTETITITAGANIKANITLRALLTEGTGTFRWNIPIPNDVISAEMIISPAGAEGTARQTVYLSQFNTAGYRTLNSGVYNITINLEKPGGKKVVWHKLLYVYQNLESFYSYTFTDAHFYETSYTVTYSYNNGSANGSESVPHGGKAMQPDNLVRSGYLFRGWFTDNNTFNNRWDFSLSVTDSVTLYARWVVIGDEIIINPDDRLTLNVDDELILTAMLAGDIINVIWSSDKPDVVYVNSNGLIYARSAGDSIITATHPDSGKKTECIIRVYDNEHSKRYIAKPFTGADKIKYSYTLNGYDFYYYYLGEMSYIPLFTGPLNPHEGSTKTFTFSQSNINAVTISESVSTSSSETRSTVESTTNSTTTRTNVYAEASAKASFFGIGASAKTTFEKEWIDYVEKTIISGFQLTTSLTKTSEYATTDTVKIKQETTKSVGPHNRPGFYRFTMFSSSDVYLVVIRDSKTKEFVDFEFYEYVIPNSIKDDSWVWDYSADRNFEKTDDSEFEFDTSILDNLGNLPKPELDLGVPGDKLAAKLNWLKDNARDGLDYIIEVDANESINPAVLSYNGKNVNITLRSKGERRTVSLSSNGDMFTAESGVTLVLENITLQGRNNNSGSLVRVNSGGALKMNTGALLTGNTAQYSGGGVLLIANGTFEMNGGEISGNKAARVRGGGVYVGSSVTFIMNDGIISGNSAVYDDGYGGGGGVCVGESSGTFIMNGGIISGNSAYGNGGGGVWVTNSSTFEMNGGIISGNSAYGQGAGGGVVIDNSCSFIMNGGIISGNSSAIASKGGGGVYVGSGCTFRIINGTIYGSNESVVANKNTTPVYFGTIRGAAVRNLGTAQYGVFNGNTWVSKGNLAENSNNTIRVVNGTLQ
ncbi:MAG: InlB B-repeat-containing protein [Treponema sp.]|nr:InlB B-repeat-containing protein [Treponema sp.]